MPRRSAFGSIEEVERGKRYRVRWWGDSHDGGGYRRHSRVIRGTRREAEEFRSLMHVRHGEDAPCPTVGEAWELWYRPDCDRALAVWERERRPGKRGESMKPQTHMQVMSTWRAHVAPRWACVPVSGVRYSDVQEWLLTKTEQVAKRCLSMLRGILRLCVLNEVLDRNVAEYGYRMPSRASKADHGVWTLEELDERLWPAVWGRLSEPTFLLSAFGSCRSGECLAPMLDEIEAVEAPEMTLAVVPIRRQVYNDGGVSDEDDLKNRWSPRTVVVPEPWSLRVLQLRDEGLGRGDVWLTDDGLGEPPSQRRVREDFYRALDAAGIPRRQMRALRRSWRSWMAVTGVSREVMEKMMGHVGDGTTGRHYLQLDAELISKELLRAMGGNKIEVGWDFLGPSRPQHSDLPAVS